eukprot:TRINITY_DN18930_c0_g1_i1.p1 TRINITY_DN18930_c0_g1~~TRINITY_DN18930_c0_g1_i1.p1  ORF type:complete len:521 (+),score=78.36 TRINITY_DN18930_c0_g1_i1:150-1712(+)
MGGDEGDGLSGAAGASFIINACMGMGFLAMPYSFMLFGVLPSLLVTMVLGVLSLLTGLWIGVTMSLASALCRGSQDEAIRERVPLRSGEIQQEKTPFGAEASPATVVKHLSDSGGPDVFEVSRSFQLTYTSLVELVLGVSASHVTVAAMCFAVVGALWSYAALVASSLAAMVPLPGFAAPCDVYADWSQPHCRTVYYTYLSIFGGITTILTVLDLKHQKAFQIAMTLCRILLVVAMVGDCIRMVALDEAPPQPGSSSSTVAQHHGGDVGASEQLYDPTAFPARPSLWHVDFYHAPQLVAVAAGALAVHPMIPDVARELRDKKTSMLPSIFVSLTCCLFFYCLIGAVVPMAFGHWVRPVCSLNWVSYTAGHPRADIWAKSFRQFVLLVPVVDITAAYPIIAQTLASNLYTTIVGPGADGVPFYWRLVCGVLPLFGAALVFDVAVVFGWTGVLTLPFIFIMPQLMLLRAEEMCCKEFGAKAVYESTYWRWYCHRRLVQAALVVGVAFFVVSALFIGSSYTGR